ncbi:Threonylcarbamoyladenosine tRNA methylthiotransferase MtaB [subsurface metagenome]
MKTFAINTLGCKVNQYESQQIRELLERLGLDQVETSKEKPDLVVINTCCVTHTASAKSRKYIRRAQKLSPGAVIIACGCLPTVQIGEFSVFDENIRVIAARRDLAADLTRIVNSKTAAGTAIKADNRSKIHHKADLAHQPLLPPITAFKGHTRAFLKVQDGCDGRCSYCIIPKTRPIVHSKQPRQVLQEARALVEAGHKEIVVTGVFLGAYGQPSVRRSRWPNQRNDKLAELLEELAQTPKLARIRLSSLEPADVTQRLLDTFCKYDNIMPHLHLSLQSGSDAVLKRMCRQYRADDFAETIRLITSRLDRPAMTADFIVGFPGETEQDFAQTLAVAKLAGFSKIHIFPFSERNGTAAVMMEDTVNKEVIRRRISALKELEKRLAEEYRNQFIGEIAEVLIEDEVKKTGRAERYFKVQIKDAHKFLQKNELVKVRLAENNADGMVGSVE